MAPWLRALGPRMALLCALVSTMAVGHAATAKPDLPALLDSFDQAFSLVYDAAERRVAQLEAGRPAPPRHDVSAMLDALADRVAAACDAATTALDVELAGARWLSPERRLATLGCIERHLGEARRDLAHADDPALRAEYELTCDRLRDVRRMI